MPSKPLPPLERLRELLSYDPITGQFHWKVWRGCKAVPGAPAGRIDNTGCRRICIDGVRYVEHRVAYLMGHGVDPGPMLIDHINGDRVDNRLANLRPATVAQNRFNSRGHRSAAVPYKGVTRNPHTRRYQARIQVDGKAVSLGTFDTPWQAHRAYAIAAAELHGEFARVA